jgi:hypothetical protein
MPRFIIVPAGTFTDPSGFEDVGLVPLTFPPSLYLDFDPNVAGSIVKDGSNNVTKWTNTLGTQALDTPGVASAYPLWTASDLNGLPSIDINNGATKALWSSADILHNLSLGYSFAAVFNAPVMTSVSIFNSSGIASNVTSAFYSAALTWRNNGSESLNFGALPGGTWLIITGTYNATGNVCKVWNSGTLINTLNSAGAPTASRKLSLGWNTVFNARIKFARFQFYNTTLSPAEQDVVRDILAAKYALP